MIQGYSDIFAWVLNQGHWLDLSWEGVVRQGFFQKQSWVQWLDKEKRLPLFMCVCTLWYLTSNQISDFFLTLSFLSPQLLEAFLMLSSIYNSFFRVLPTSSGELRHMKCMLPPFLCVECPSSLPSVKTNLQFPNKCPSEFQLRWSFLMLHLKQNVLGMPSTSVLVPCPPTSSLSILF